uniref:Cytochrome c oxidase subunit 3 n=1 Tax=Liposcelis nr. bostrychophila AZ TaxID=1643344 RepID=A0A0F6TMH5_9NEOP|nr:cytochrome c oxidase subunit III [Liposcelis nr. bostrychophila AZ]
MKNKFNDFHSVNNSPWPLYASLAVLNLMLSTFWSFYSNMGAHSFFSMFNVLLMVSIWARDILRESVYQGNHTSKVMASLKYGMLLFISSEIMFFLSFFWTFFHSSLNPDCSLGYMWPSWGVRAVSPLSIPLLNTLILISSGVTITYSHHMMLAHNWEFSIKWTIYTILLGVYFTILQGLEYKFTSFTMMDSIYGSIFFMSTGFHGFHVILGTIFISLSLMRLIKLEYSNSHHLMFEFSCWYWHFVDLVWLFLFLFIYWWGF